MTDEELERLSENYDYSEGDAYRANRELDRREMERQQKLNLQSQNNQFWFNMACSFMMFVATLSACVAAFIAAWPVAQPWWENFFRQLHFP